MAKKQSQNVEQSHPERHSEPHVADATKGDLAVEIEANRLLLAALRELTVLASQKIEDAQSRIEHLKEERKTQKTFSSFREINALRKFHSEFGGVAGALKSQMAAVRKSQDELLTQNSATSGEGT